MRVLHLTLKEPWFTLTQEDEKPEEFRVDSKWIRSRLYNKDGTKKEYDVILFVNGYGSHRPRVMRKYEGFEVNEYHEEIAFSNCPVINLNPGDFRIKSSKI